MNEKIVNYTFSGKGPQEQPMITFPGSITLMMYLPGEIAKRSQAKATEILVLYCAGDMSLITEIEANAKPSSPVAQMARESLGVLTEEEMTRKKRREDIELEMMQVDLDQSKGNVETL